MVDVFTPSSTPFTNDKPAQVEVVGNPAPGVIARSHEPSTPAQDRWQADRAAAAKGDPWQGDPSKTMLVRQADGSIIEQSRRDGGTNGVPVDGNQLPPGDPQQQPAPDRIRVGDLELTADDLKGLMERKSLEDGRRASMPKDAAGYELALPSDFVLPEGQTYKFATDDPVLGPLLGQAKLVAHDLGIDQNGFSRLPGLFAASQINEQRMIATAGAKELDKLGSNANNRVDAVRTFLRAHLGDELAGALRRGMHTERQVVAYERLMQKFTNQGGSSYSGAHREVNQPERLSNEAYNKLTYTEKKDYAANFGQR
jgi:hypothetical protein